MTPASGRVTGATALLLGLGAVALAGDGVHQTGPETEKRFPPLQVPAGFKATLFASDPLVEYPSALAAGPRAGSLFVAADYLTGLGYDIVRHDEVRRLDDSDGDGYADRVTVVAAQLNSIQGLAYEDRGTRFGTLFVMHAPLLSRLRDGDGDGSFEQRHDVLTGLGLPPERNPSRLHCANGVVLGWDGWLYLALGDNGCDVPRPEGDRLTLRGGGILRCRPDGRDLHVFATGLRNIYDVAVDDDLNVFVRDNENDGGSYMIRVAHSFFSADHGYPYLYDERPAEAFAPLADLGRGSSAGGLVYQEDAFAPEYRGNLFFCEWGRAVMRYRPQRAGSSFAPLHQIEFATGAPDDPYGFKPTDLIVDRDGALVVADWGDGQRPKRGRGRIYRIAFDRPAPAGDPEIIAGSRSPRAIAALDSPRATERQRAQEALIDSGEQGATAVREALAGHRLGVQGRIHAVWVLARRGGPGAIAELLDMARTDPEPRVQVQAIRAIADLSDPVLESHRLEPAPGDAALAARLAALAPGKDARVVLEVVIAVGRLRWAGAASWLLTALSDPDPAQEHAAMQTLRRAQTWRSVLKLLDEPDAAPIRRIALHALADRYETEVVDGLIARLQHEPDPQRRQEYADLLTRVAHKPGPAPYWGYRPAPRPASTLEWERTDAVVEALDRTLADPDQRVRLAILQRMEREQVATRMRTLASWLRTESDPDAVAAIVTALRRHPADQPRPLLEALIADPEHTLANRLMALELWASGLDGATRGRLLTLAGLLADGPVLAALLRHLGKHPALGASAFLIGKLESPDPEVRTGAVEALAELRPADAGESVRALLEDPDIGVRRAAIAAVGRLGVRSANDRLLALSRSSDEVIINACLRALRQNRVASAVPVAIEALGSRSTQLAALEYLEDLGGPEQLREVAALARANPPSETLHQVLRAVSHWSRREATAPPQRDELRRALGLIQGSTGIVARWEVAGPIGETSIVRLMGAIGAPGTVLYPSPDVPQGWREELATGLDSQLRLRADRPAQSDSNWVLCSDVELPEPTPVQVLSGSAGRLRVWCNGRPVYERASPRPFVPDADRFDITLDRGPTRLVVAVTPGSAVSSFHLRFRRKGSSAEHERLMQRALAVAGSAERGRAVFHNPEKAPCLKCHRMRDQGVAIGPELTGVGARFPRAHLIESVLEPSRTISPSFETVAVALTDGRVLAGVRTAETATTLSLADTEAKVHVLMKAEIETQRPQSLSLMPEGLEKLLTADEFVDLIAFLVGEK
jgi:putative membrane-bound dehydrogenase-like protein